MSSNRLVLGLYSVLAGGASGGVVTAIGAFVTRAVPAQMAFILFGFFVLVGAVIAGVTVWGFSHSLSRAWRGVAIAIAVIGTVVLAGGTLPVEGIFGLTGLSVYLLAELVVAVLVSRAARKAVHDTAPSGTVAAGGA